MSIPSPIALQPLMQMPISCIGIITQYCEIHRSTYVHREGETYYASIPGDPEYQASEVFFLNLIHLLEALGNILQNSLGDWSNQFDYVKELRNRIHLMRIEGLEMASSSRHVSHGLSLIEHYAQHHSVIPQSVKLDLSLELTHCQELQLFLKERSSWIFETRLVNRLALKKLFQLMQRHRITVQEESRIIHLFQHLIPYMDPSQEIENIIPSSYKKISFTYHWEIFKLSIQNFRKRNFFRATRYKIHPSL